MVPGDGNYQGLVFQCVAMAALGVLASHLLASYGSSRDTEGRDHERRGYKSCEAFISSTQLPGWVKLGSKTPYQFLKGAVRDESYLEGCKAVQVDFTMFSKVPSFIHQQMSPWNC